MLSAIRTRSMHVVLGGALLVVGMLVVVARPGIALAHHVMISDRIDCAGWETKAEYVGGSADRLVVVDVVINGKVISQSFYFDNKPGHIGHQDYYLLYDRSGSGPLHTSGTVTLYEKSRGNRYDVVSGAESTNIDLNCVTPTSSPAAPTETATPIATATAADTATPVATSTASAIATNTPPATATESIFGTVGPLVTETPAATSSSAGTTPSAPSTLNATTPGAPGSGTPVLTSSVRGLTHPESPSDKPSAPNGSRRTFPATGDGAHTRTRGASGVLGTLLAAAGLLVVALGMRTKRVG